MEHSTLQKLKKDQVWQRRVVESELSNAQNELSRYFQLNSPRESIRFVEKNADLLSRRNDHASVLRAWCYQAAALQLASKDPSVPMQKIESLFQRAKGILESQKINPTRSHLAFLHGHLNRSLAEGYSARGRHWLASWHGKIAEKSLARPQGKWERRLEPAEASLRLGDVSAALDILDQLAGSAMSTEEKWRVALAYSKCYRLAGDPLRALGLISGLSTKSSPSSELMWKLKWEKIRCQCQTEGNLAKMSGFLIRSKAQRRQNPLPDFWPQILLEARLWAFCVKNTGFVKTFPDALRIRGQYQKIWVHDSQRVTLFTFVRGLEACLEDSELLTTRVEKLGLLLESSAKLRDLEMEILLWSAAARFLYRVRQKEMFEMCKTRLRSLSLGLSSGETTDVLGFMRDTEGEAEHCLPAIRAGLVTRTALYGSITLRLGKALGPKRLSRVISGEKPRLSDGEISDVVDILVEGMGALKGPVMKLGQIAGCLFARLPSKSRRVLDTLQNHSTAIDGKEIRKTLEREMGQPLQRIFKSFDDRPLGTGSIGQVHAARLQDGREVAVKVQYPDIEKAVVYDLRVLKSLAPFINALAPHINFGKLVTELEKGLREECDYTRELERQNTFHQLYLDHPDIFIPRALPEFSNKKVLVSELVKGRKFGEFSASATQEQKDRAGKSIVTFVVSSCRDGCFNTDPHPGNYIFTGDKVAFIDFGSVKTWDPGGRRNWSDLIKGSALNDRALFGRALKGMNPIITEGGIDLIYNVVCSGEAGVWTTPGCLSMNMNALEKQIQVLVRPDGSQGSPSLPAEYAYGYRVYFGHVAVVAALGAQADWNRLVRDIMGV